jgi:ABC-type glutathione transport system ATPase component
LITGGQVLFAGRDVLEMGETELEQFRWQSISIVFQSAMNALNPIMRIRDQILDVMQYHGISKSDANKKAKSLFDLVGIDPRRLDAYPHQLSGCNRDCAGLSTTDVDHG